MFKLTSQAFIGMDRERLSSGLQNIKVRREQSLRQPDHKEEIRGYKKEIEDLSKAVDKLDQALRNISIVVGANMSGSYPVGESPIELLTDGVLKYKLTGNIPVRQIGATSSHETILRQRSVSDVAGLYKRLTGLEATITVKVSGSKRSGRFKEFLLACAQELGVSSDGLVKRAEILRGRGTI